MKRLKWIIALVAGACVWCLSGMADITTRQGVRALSLRAAGGDPKALYDLARLHESGYDSIPVDTLRSIALYRLSAQRGYPPAQSYLGVKYFTGEGVSHNVDSALYWFAKAAGQGDPRAANNLGFLLAEGTAVKRDYPQAIRWLSLASEAGLPTAQSILADLYRQGHGTLPDTAKAEKLYMAAIEGGLADAQLKLLAMMGNKWKILPPDSALSLGRYHYTHRAPLIGITLFENVAASCVDPDPLTNEPPSLAAQYAADAFALLGDAYSRAVGVEYDHDRSVAFFLRGALMGNPSAQFVIAELLDIFPDALSSSPAKEMVDAFYEAGRVPDDIYAPPYWYALAAEKGVTEAATATRLLLNP